MTVVVTDNCRLCRFTECVAVCPTAAFRAGEDMLYVDPVACVDCGACVPVCPVHAIYFEHDLPADKSAWLAANRDNAATLPVIAEQGVPLPGAQERRAALGL